MASRAYLFSLPGITCVNCVRPVEQALASCHTLKIELVSVDVVEKRILIQVEDDRKPEEVAALLKAEIEGVGVECVQIIDDDNQDISPNPVAAPKLPDQKKVIRSHLIKGIFASALGLALMLLMMWAGAIPLYLMYALVIGSSILTLGFGIESYKEASKKLVYGKTFTMDSLFAVSSLTVVGVSIAGLFFPWLPMMMDAGLMIFGFRHIGKAIEESITKSVTANLKFKDRAPRIVEKISEDQTSRLSPVKELLVDDIILVRSGKMLPVDGVLLDDESSLYDTIITGSTLPRRMRQGDKVLAGMRVPNDVAFVKIRVTHKESDSYLSKLDKKIALTNSEKAPIEETASKVLQYFVPAVLTLALASGVAVGIMFNPALAFQCASSLLVSACPCTLGFITPMAIKIGMAKAVENGVQFKSSKALQMADQIDTVIFDLNGTLTTGVPEVSGFKVDPSSALSQETCLDYLALLEGESDHPVAKAICRYVNNEKKISRNSNLTLEALDRSKHSGIRANINGEWCLVGNKHFMLQHHMDVSLFNEELKKKEDEQVVYFAKNGKVVSYILWNDPLRDDAKETISELQKMGKKVHICTGADEETALRYAKKLNIPPQYVCGNCVGSDNTNDKSKVQYIEQLQKQGHRVAMVGDAANDTHAISKSDLGIAVKSDSGDVMAQQEAGVVVDKTSLMPVVTAFAVAKQTVSNIKQNLILSLTYNTAAMLVAGGIFIALGFTINPGIGVALMVLQTSLILLNQYRLKRQALPHLKDKNQKTSVPKPCSQSSYKHFFQKGMFSKDAMQQTKEQQSSPNETKLSPNHAMPTPSEKLPYHKGAFRP